MSLRFHGLSHRYGDQVVLRDVTVAAHPGKILCLLGPSGSGKSTLLRLAAGLEAVQSGRIELDDALLASVNDHPPPERRSVGMVFQDHVLFPHRTVLQNVAFGLRHLTKEERNRIAAEHLERVGLTDFGARFPHTLSGGQAQRVALARALATGPRVMLLDEPFASVDATLRRSLREQARRTLMEADTITIIVTHDAEEALELADSIAYLDQGRLLQVATPEEIWKDPADRKVAMAFGEAQGLDGRVDGRVVQTGFGELELPLPWESSAEVDVVARPEAITAIPNEDSSLLVTDVRYLGRDYLVMVRGGDRLLRVRQERVDGLAPGQNVECRFDPAGCYVFARS